MTSQPIPMMILRPGQMPDDHSLQREMVRMRALWLIRTTLHAYDVPLPDEIADRIVNDLKREMLLAASTYDCDWCEAPATIRYGETGLLCRGHFDAVSTEFLTPQ